MAAILIPGQTTWEVSRDDEGQREYVIKHKVRSLTTDGPNTILNCPGLPLIGSSWDFDGDSDPWAFCSPRASVRPIVSGEPNVLWEVTQYFSTQPRQSCADETIDDPLLIPPRISGSFVKYTKEATKDRYGNPLQSSSYEQFRGPNVEFDANRPTVRIEINTLNLNLATLVSMVDTVNESTQWGLGPRKIKLDNAPWERNLFGTCDYYYTIAYEFSIDFNGFDRDLLDEGKKVLNGQWAADGTWELININELPPDPGNPAHFIAYKDRNGENTRVMLDGSGKPLNIVVGTGTGTEGSPYFIHVEKYEESDFFELGIPSTF